MVGLNVEDIKQVAFEKIRVMAGTTLPLGVQANMELKASVDQMIRGLVCSLESVVLGFKTEQIDVEEKWPADWWQALRERWFPVWWLRKYPVRHKRISLHRNLYRVCPHVPVKLDSRDYSAHFQWMFKG